jgi:DNA-binding MarR family transcriptional regulator
MKLEEEIKQKKFRSEFQKLIINILFTGNSIQASQNKLFKPSGISLQQFNILRILRGQHPNPATLGLIQERMLDKNSNASRLVDKLKLKKMVDRKESKTDRRQVDIVITQKGLDTLAELDVLIQKQEYFLNILSETEAKKMNEFLDQLRDKL